MQAYNNNRTRVEGEASDGEVIGRIESMQQVVEGFRTKRVLIAKILLSNAFLALRRWR